METTKEVTTKEVRTSDQVREYMIRSLLKAGHSVSDVARLIGVSIQQVERLRDREGAGGD